MLTNTKEVSVEGTESGAHEFSITAVTNYDKHSCSNNRTLLSYSSTGPKSNRVSRGGIKTQQGRLLLLALGENQFPCSYR